MKSFLIVLCLFILGACVDNKNLYSDENLQEYVNSFSNRKEIKVNITSPQDGQVYAVYYQYPYEEGSLVKQPALMGKTPINTSLQVPKDVEELYILGNGKMYESSVKDILINATSRSSASQSIDENVLAAINSSYFPEATNNVRSENLFKCTDLVIAETGSTGNFNEADVWMTFIGDGGSRQGGLYGKIWFYTYNSDKQNSLEKEDCSFFGLVDGQIQAIPYSDIEKKNHYIFYTKEELSSGGISSYKKYKLGTFEKGVSIGFVYYGNSKIQFTTPHLNEKVNNFTLKYLDGKGSFKIENQYIANGFIRHIQEGTFEGNILGMENRSITEAKYDGDYNDMLCLLESNPLAINPSEPIDPPVIDEYKTTTGLYLFEDNYPTQGDFDFNDAVIEYKIIDYYKTSNKAKQVIAKLLAKGALYENEFGFKVGNSYSPFLKGLKGYENVRPEQQYTDLEQSASYTLYGDIKPYLYNGTNYIFDTNYNTGVYPYVLEIPISDPEDANWKFLWCSEGNSIDACYYFLQSANGGPRTSDWYKTPKDATKTFQR